MCLGNKLLLIVVEAKSHAQAIAQVRTGRAPHQHELLETKMHLLVFALCSWPVQAANHTFCGDGDGIVATVM